ncbi:aldehyde ferredoxin oxidoreductase family protein [Halomarina oriensis]|uniref:Aldehyde ferredoxin oxidoreductase n=1 Tax=Halomarina oriensis TaxID=671145 RepID=A0A6B0GKT3_9EURY|nr:aldehyde ferredoxin oxidoreductase [Halomarina oriensis]
MTGRQRDAVLRVDLTAGTVERTPVPERWRRRYLGGKGLGARYLYDELDAGTDPLGPDNLLGLVWGPLSGYLPGESRLAVVTKSPLTGGFLDSYVGGAVPDALAGALPDCLGVFVTGRASDPTTLVVEADGSAHLDRADCWGATTDETDAAYDGAVACIGPAGEHRVRYATVATDGGDHHAGRGGVGAVFGAKRLKAVVARGDPPTLPDPLVDLQKTAERRYDESDVGRWQAVSGTLESVDFADAAGVLATRGWRESRFEGSEGIGVAAARDAATEREGDETGGFRVETSDGDAVPRGAASMSLGAGLGIDDFDAVATLGATCDRLGIDVIDAGSAVAWAVRAGESGLLDRSLSFGDPAAARELVVAIAHREGTLADTLADGLDAAAARYGGAALVPSVKSMALPAYDPRSAPAMALAYATSDRGACHRRARPIETEAFDGERWTDRERVERVVGAQTARSALWSLVADDFVGATLEDLGAPWLRALGGDHDARTLTTLGERVWTLTRLFNVREGFDRRDDALPGALTRTPADGDRALSGTDFERLLSTYYAVRGWGPEGRPTAATLERLDLTGVADASTPLDDHAVTLERPADD